LQYKIISFVRRSFLCAALCVLLAAAIIWGAAATVSSIRYKRQLEATYNKAFYEMADALSSVQVQLSKLLVSASPGKNAELLSDISRQSDSAAVNLAALPLKHRTLADTLEFFNLVGDFCSALSRQTGEGQPPSAKTQQSLLELNNVCAVLCAQVDELKSRGFTFDAETEYNTAGGQMDGETSSAQEGIEYPHLIYDGPFSESLKNVQPMGLPYGETDEQAALGNAAVFMGADISEVDIVSCSDDVLAGYIISCRTDGEETFLKVTRQGGAVQWMIAQGLKAGEVIISADEAIACAREFLAQMGYGGLALTWAQQYDGIYVLSFAAQQNGAVCYSDMIKLRVRMDTGEVVGFDATAWLMNHRLRALPTVMMDTAQAEAFVSPQLEVTMRQLAYVPLEGGGEALCYGFSGTFGGDMFLVYIDAVTGEEVDIFRVVEMEDGAAVI